LELVTNPVKLRQIRSKLEANRLTHPLFNAEMYIKHLEHGYRLAYDRYFNGYSPEVIIVPA